VSQVGFGSKTLTGSIFEVSVTPFYAFNIVKHNILPF
jgi:hypothetical protein